MITVEVEFSRSSMTWVMTKETLAGLFGNPGAIRGLKVNKMWYFYHILGDYWYNGDNVPF